MISSSCDIKEFLKAVDGNEYMEVIYIANQEATEAERFLYRSKVSLEEKQRYGVEYAGLLKIFLFYLRYGVKPSGLSDEHLDLFQGVRDRSMRLAYPRPTDR